MNGMTRDVDEELIRRLTPGKKNKTLSNKKGARWNRNNPQKTRAHTIAYQYGFKNRPCEHCGSEERIEKHHPDYSKPLLVIFLCKTCHVTEHVRLRKVNAK